MNVTLDSSTDSARILPAAGAGRVDRRRRLAVEAVQRGRTPYYAPPRSVIRGSRCTHEQMARQFAVWG